MSGLVDPIQDAFDTAGGGLLEALSVPLEIQRNLNCTIELACAIYDWVTEQRRESNVIRVDFVARRRL